MTNQATLGAYLRAARRHRRISIERAADQTRIRSDYLVRMEWDEFDFLAPAYVRGFVRTYARFLRLDPGAVVEQFDHMFGREEIDTSTIIALEKRINARPRRMSSWAAASVVALAVFAGLAAVGIASAPPEAEAPVAHADLDGANIARDADRMTTPTPDSAQAIAFTDGIDLEVTATNGDCWLEVYADGELLYYEILSQGETQSFQADNRMFIELGFPRAVELTVNGQNIGSPGGEEPMELLFPRDIRGLL